MAGSVGGSGGQMSLAVGSLDAATLGGHVGTSGFAGSAGGTGSGSATGSATASTGGGTVCAHDGADFCIGSAGLGSVSSSATASAAGGTVSAQDGVGFCIGTAGTGSAVAGGVDAAISAIGSAAAGSGWGWDAAVSSGSSGSVWGSNAGVTSGNSGSSAIDAPAAPELVCARQRTSGTGGLGGAGSGLVSGADGEGPFSSCGSTRRSVYPRCATAAATISLTRTRWSAHLPRSGRAATPPSQLHRTLHGRTPPGPARHLRPSSSPAR
jgi:hypothetical protein